MRSFFLIFAFLFLSNGYAQDSDTAAKEDPAFKAADPFSVHTAPFSGFGDIETSEDEEEEEAQERFYGFGRMVHISAFGSACYLLGSMSEIYTSTWMAGVRISYFIDWDIAIILQLGIGTMTMDFRNTNTATQTTVPYFTGSAYLLTLGAGLKYYLNFYDVSRAMAYLNPALILGAEIVVINDSLDENIRLLMTNLDTNFDYPSHRSVAPGLFLGINFEIPIFRKSVYLGAEFIYHLTFFSSTHPEIPFNDPYFGRLDYSGTFMSFGGYLTWNL